MQQKTIMAVSLLVVLTVGSFAIVGLTKSYTGAVTKFTVHQERRLCECIIQRYDYYGNPIGKVIQVLRVPTGQAHTDLSCNHRCDLHFGRPKKTHELVYGKVAPAGRMQRVGYVFP